MILIFTVALYIFYLPLFVGTEYNSALTITAYLRGRVKFNKYKIIKTRSSTKVGLFLWILNKNLDN